VINTKDKRLGAPVNIPIKSLLLRHAKLSDGISFSGEATPVLGKGKYYADVILFAEVIGWQHFAWLLNPGNQLPLVTPPQKPSTPPIRTELCKSTSSVHDKEKLRSSTKDQPDLKRSASIGDQTRIDTRRSNPVGTVSPLVYPLDKRKDIDRHMAAILDLKALCSRINQKRAQPDIHASGMLKVLFVEHISN